MDGICSYLKDVDLLFVDIEFILFVIKSFVIEPVVHCIPKIWVRRHRGPKWFVRHHLNCLQTLRKKYKCHPTVHKELKIRSLEEILQFKMAHAKLKFENKTFQSGQSHQIYEYIRNSSGLNEFPLVISKDNICAVTDYETVSLFNRYFIPYVLTVHLGYLQPATSQSPSLL